MALCFAFQRGECDRGASCRFIHETSGSGGDGGARSDDAGKRGICYTFQKTGYCEFGDTCKFSHNLDGDNADSGRSDAFANFSRGGSSKGLKSQGTCYAYQRGECDRGASCKFSHGAADFSGSGGSRGMCYAFQRGECSRGKFCKFSHSTSSGESFVSGDSGNGGARRKTAGVCYAWQTGECDRGESCRFSHELGDVPMDWSGPSPQGVCYAFQRGECERGTACRFSHKFEEGSELPDSAAAMSGAI